MFGFKIIQEPHSGAFAFAATAWRVDHRFGRGKPILAWCANRWIPWPVPIFRF